MGVLKLKWLLRMEGRCLISRKMALVVLDPVFKKLCLLWVTVGHLS